MDQEKFAEMIANAVAAAMATKDAASVTTRPNGERFEFVPEEAAKELKGLTKGERIQVFGRAMRALVKGGGSVASAIRVSREVYGDGEESMVQKLLWMGDDPSGGFLVPEDVSSAFIELLAEVAVVRGMGPTTFPMPSGNMTINGGLSGPTAYYIGETDAIPVSDAKFRQVKLSLKKLAGLVPFSNDLLRTSSPQADSIVTNWLVQAMARREDLAFIRGDGTNNTPLGLAGLAGYSETISGSTPDDVRYDLSKMRLFMRQANIMFNKTGWLMSPRTEDFLMNLKDGTNGYPYREEVQGGKLLGYPIGVTTQIPETLGAGSNESELYLVNFGDIVIGDTLNIRVDTSNSASYEDGGSVRSAYQNDMTLLRAISEHDINTMHIEAIAMLTAVTWGE